MLLIMFMLFVETNVRTFFIEKEKLIELLDENPLLEERLWKIFGIKHSSQTT